MKERLETIAKNIKSDRVYLIAIAIMMVSLLLCIGEVRTIDDDCNEYWREKWEEHNKKAHNIYDYVIPLELEITEKAKPLEVNESEEAKDNSTHTTQPG